MDQNDRNLFNQLIKLGMDSIAFDCQQPKSRSQSQNPEMISEFYILKSDSNGQQTFSHQEINH
jgi:hypothetical protein